MLALNKLFAPALSICLAFPAAAADLVMVERVGCTWCEKWNKEIGPIYPKTSEGKYAPLVRVDLHDIPSDIDLKRRVIFTPTFLLVEDGQEIGRLEGYPGEDFFWPILSDLLSTHTTYQPTTSESG